MDGAIGGGEPPLSIAIVTGSASRLAGGLFHSVRRTALELAAAGHRVTVLALEDAYAQEDAAAWRPLVPRLAKSWGPTAVGFAPPVGRALAEGDFDLVHQHGLWQALSLHVSSWRRRTGRPVMISPRGMLDPWAVRNSRWKKEIARKLFEDANLAGAACIHALTRAEEAAIRAFGLSTPVVVIPNGTDLPTQPQRDRRVSPDGRRTLLFLGRLHPKKGIGELLAAWAGLKTLAPQLYGEWRLVVAGWDDGGYGASLPRLAEALGIGGEVAFPGGLFGEDKAAALHEADAFILPSHSEGMPMAVLEAWAHGLPVFMTAECNIPEGFRTGAALRISADADRLAAQLADGLARPDLHEFGDRGRALVAREFSWQRVAARHIETYRGMMVRGETCAGRAAQRHR